MRTKHKADLDRHLTKLARLEGVSKARALEMSREAVAKLRAGTLRPVRNDPRDIMRVFGDEIGTDLRDASRDMVRRFERRFTDLVLADWGQQAQAGDFDPFDESKDPEVFDAAARQAVREIVDRE